MQNAVDGVITTVAIRMMAVVQMQRQYQDSQWNMQLKFAVVVESDQQNDEIFTNQHHQFPPISVFAVTRMQHAPP